MAKRNSRRDNPHAQIHYVLDRCTPTRKDIAKQLGISRQTLADWEYQRTKVRDHMLVDIQRVTGFDLSTIPAQLVQRDLDAVLNPTKKREQPPQPKSDYDAQGKAQKEREARQEAKANDPKRHRIRNYGVPTDANQNPYTFSRIHDGHRPKLSKGIDLPSDAEYPDMIAAALKGLTYYEAAYVGYHTIPDATGPSVGNTPHVCGICAGFYWNRPNGSYSQAETIDKANAMMAKQIAEDEAATADLI